MWWGCDEKVGDDVSDDGGMDSDELGLDELMIDCIYEDTCLY